MSQLNHSWPFSQLRARGATLRPCSCSISWEGLGTGRGHILADSSLGQAGDFTAKGQQAFHAWCICFLELPYYQNWVDQINGHLFSLFWSYDSKVKVLARLVLSGGRICSTILSQLMVVAAIFGVHWLVDASFQSPPVSLGSILSACLCVSVFSSYKGTSYWIMACSNPA